MLHNREHVLDCLMQGDDIFDPADARAYLSSVMDEIENFQNPDVARIALPIARECVKTPYWAEMILTPDALVLNCMAHVLPFTALEPYCEDDLDPQALYLQALAGQMMQWGETEADAIANRMNAEFKEDMDRLDQIEASVQNTTDLMAAIRELSAR